MAIELIYSQQSSDFVPGRAYSNPRFFTTPRVDVAKVYLVGDWPKIQDAYEALGVPVERLDAADALARPEAAGPTPELTAKIKGVGKGRKPKVHAPEADRPGDLPSTQGTSEAEVDVLNAEAQD